MPVPNTIIIYDQCGVEPLTFFSVKGDKSSLDKVFINSTECSEDKQGRLNKLLYGEDGKFKLTAYSEFPTTHVRPGTKVIVCGFLP